VTRVALLGFGTVGSAVARRLLEDDRHQAPRFHLTHIFDRRAEEKSFGFDDSAAGARGFSLSTPPVWTSRIDDVLRSDADIVVETIGGIVPAVDWIRAALGAGKSVVTANKQVVAKHGPTLWQFAARQGRQFRFEAAVGGAMPIVRALSDGLAGDRLVRLIGILNGTTNAVLSRMESDGCSLAVALAEARARGYAEADPSADLDGDDARAKLAILCALAFGLRVDSATLPARSAAAIDSAAFAQARRQNGTIRQLAYAEYDYARRVLTAGVGPARVDLDSIFGRTVGAQNVALATGEHGGDVGIFGQGAGGPATAVAIISDIASIARDRAAIVPAPQLTSEFSLRAPEFVFRGPTCELETTNILQTSGLLSRIASDLPVEAL
jgi:homoserine dehydrogenase